MQDQPNLTEPEQEILKLEQQLSEAVAAEHFFETTPGKLWMELATAEINRIVNDITSDKYRKDLLGYNNALSDLAAYKKMIRKMQVAASPARKSKLEERLEVKGAESQDERRTNQS